MKERGVLGKDTGVSMNAGGVLRKAWQFLFVFTDREEAVDSPEEEHSGLVRKSPPPQNYQLIVYHYSLKY